MHTPHRPPSVAWEPLRFGPGGAVGGWVWFYPATAPLTVQIQVPAESLQQLGGEVTPQGLLEAAGLPLAMVRGWETQGRWSGLERDGSGELSQPFLAVPGNPLVVTVHLKPLPVPGATGGVWSTPPSTAPYPGEGALPGTGAVESESARVLLDALEADWFAILQIERNLEAMRKQLAALQGRLQSLNRDLNPEEFRAADNQDRKDWTDARRWLRSSCDQLSRYMREYDIGSVSAAGGRLRFESLYRSHIETRRPFEGMAATRLEFEAYRKTHQQLVVAIQAVLSNAQRDGEQRAQQVLSRITAKSRASRARR